MKRTQPPARANRRRRNRAIPLLALLLPALLAECAAAALTSPRFKVRTITVEGLEHLESARVLDVAHLSLGRNIFLAGVRGARARIAAIPEVQSVQVYRRLPGWLVIHVTERRPFAALRTSDGFALVDDGGVAIRPVAEAVAHPIVDVQPFPAVCWGKHVNGAPIHQALRALKITRARSLMVRGISVDPSLNMCLNMGGLSVRLGQPDELDGKIELLERLLGRHPEWLRTAEALNLSAPRWPALLPRPKAAGNRSPGKPKPKPIGTGLARERPGGTDGTTFHSKPRF